MEQIHKRLGVGKRQRFDQDTVDDAEERGRGADAQRDGEARGEREAARAPERPSTVADVPQRILETPRPELVACAFLRAFDAAEPDQSLSHCLVGGESGAPVLLGLLFDVEAKLLFQASFEGAAPAHRSEAPPGFGQPRHDVRPSGTAA